MHDDGWDGMDDAISWSLLARGLHTYGARGGDSGTHFPDWFDKADRFLSFLPSSLPPSTACLHVGPSCTARSERKRSSNYLFSAEWSFLVDRQRALR